MHKLVYITKDNTYLSCMLSLLITIIGKHMKTRFKQTISSD